MDFPGFSQGKMLRAKAVDAPTTVIDVFLANPVKNGLNRRFEIRGLVYLFYGLLLQRRLDQLRDLLMDALIIVISNVMPPMPAVHVDREEFDHLFHFIQIVKAPGHHTG